MTAKEMQVEYIEDSISHVAMLSCWASRAIGEGQARRGQKAQMAFAEAQKLLGDIERESREARGLIGQL